MDLFDLFFAIAWCLSGWLAWRIGQKLDGKKFNWGEKLCVLIFGPFILILAIMEYFKQKKRKNDHRRPIEQLNRKKDIYDFWDWFFGHE